MDELQIVGVVFSVVTVIAILVIAFNVVTIRRILEKRSDATDRPSSRP